MNDFDPDANRVGFALKDARIDLGHDTDLVFTHATRERWIEPAPVLLARWCSTTGYRLEVSVKVTTADLALEEPRLREVLIERARKAAVADLGDDEFRISLRKHRTKGTP